MIWPLPLSGEHKHGLGESSKERDGKTRDIADQEHMSDGPSLEQLPCWMMESVHYSKYCIYKENIVFILCSFCSLCSCNHSTGCFFNPVKSNAFLGEA